MTKRLIHEDFFGVDREVFYLVRRYEFHVAAQGFPFLRKFLLANVGDFGSFGSSSISMSSSIGGGSGCCC